MKRLTVCLYLAAILAAPSATDLAAQDQLPEILPRDLEIELALSALPVHLRADATAYVLERGGYVKAKASSRHRRLAR